MWFLILILTSPFSVAAEFESPETFTEYIYQNYASENFNKVYNNFVDELQEIVKKETYLKFQKENFEKYNLVYTEIKVGEAKEVEFDKIKAQFDYALDQGEYYQVQVNYLIKFDRFGRRDKESGKKVYLRKNNNKFHIFWDYKSVLDDETPNRDDQDE